MSRSISSCFFCLFFAAVLPTLSYAQPLQESSAQTNYANIEGLLLQGEPVHFAEDLPEEERRIEAAWITKALRNGVEKIDIRNAIITGDLDLRTGSSYQVGSNDFELKFNPEIKKMAQTLNARTVFLVSTDISIIDSRLEGKLLAGIDKHNCAVVVFQRGVRFGCIFLDEADWEGAIFQHKADFSLADFQDAVHFSNAVFQSQLICDATVFRYGINFDNTTFIGEANFTLATFQGEADFEMADFEDQADFEGAIFNSKVDFGSATFQRAAIFYGAQFSKNTDVDLRRTTYANLLISWHQLKGHLDAPYGKRGELLHRLEGIAGLSQKEGQTTKQSPSEWHTGGLEAYVILTQLPSGLEFPSQLSTKISYDSTEELLTFKGIMTKKERRELLKLSSDTAYRTAIRTLFDRSHFSDELKIESFVLWRAVYIRLQKNFEDIGDNDSANDCYYHYRLKLPKFRQESLSADFEHGKLCVTFRGAWEKTREWLEYIFFGLTCGYGVKPFRALIVIAIEIVSFAFIFFGLSHLEPLEYELKEKSKHPDTHMVVRRFADLSILHQLALCFYFSAGTFTTLLYGEIKPLGWFKVVAVIEGIMGWLTLALFLVTLGNVWLG